MANKIVITQNEEGKASMDLRGNRDFLITAAVLLSKTVIESIAEIEDCSKHKVFRALSKTLEGEIE